jgi:hypothetical protein
MYWELEGSRTNKEDYVLLAKKAKSSDLIDTIATSAPVAVISDFNKSFFDLIVSSVGFVAALSWNDVIRTSFEKGGVMYKYVGKMGLLYVAIFVTILAYILTALVKTLYPERQIAKKSNPFEKSADETARTK